MFQHDLLSPVPKTNLLIFMCYIMLTDDHYLLAVIDCCWNHSQGIFRNREIQ